jgi:hypothetical protein
MNAPTRPATVAAAHRRPPTRPAARTASHDPAVASDGLTVDTALGPVDLVAVHRHLRGFDVTLTEAERAWILRRQADSARRAAAYALGTGYEGLLRALADARPRLARERV